MKKSDFRKLIKECVKSILKETQLNEGVSLYIKDYVPQRFDRIASIVTFGYRILDKIIEQLPPDQKSYYNKNKVTEPLTVDGLEDDDKPTGTINFYYSGFTTDALHKFLNEFFKQTNELGINAKLGKLETSKMYKSPVARIEIVKNDHHYEGPPEISFTNENAIVIFEKVLQFERDQYHNFSFTAQELKDRIESVLQHDPSWIDQNRPHTNSPSLDPAMDYFKNAGFNVQNYHIDSEGIKERLKRLLIFANWAIKNGHQHLYTA